jgi:hypothetical protein
MLQRQKFLECRQEGKQSVRDYLRRLRNLAETAGDVDEREMVRQFWMNCQPYIKASLVDKGYEPNTVSLDMIERKALRTERAFAENAKDPNILLALNPTLAASYSQQPNRPPRREFKANRSAPSHRTPILHANAVSESSNDTRSKDHFKRGTNGTHSRTPPRRPYPPKKSAETLKRLRDRISALNVKKLDT